MGADIYGKALIMVISVLGQYFVFETEADPTREELKAFQVTDSEAEDEI